MKKAIICFTRVPRPGSTKTRLMGVLAPEQCARLHWAFLQDLAQVYAKIHGDLFIAHTPDTGWRELQAVFPSASGFFPQQGADLGEKMHNAIARVQDMGYEAVVLTGADLPKMNEAHLESGFSALETCDVTLGPNPDGGYYLIGMKQPHPELFHVPNYGGSTVYDNTLAAIREAGLSFSPALSCGDVDTPEDLRNLLGNLDPDSATGRCLHEFQKEGIAL